MAVDTPPPPAPRAVREKGYASRSNGWWQDPTDEETPELRWPLSVAVYDRMRRQDAQVGSVLRAATSPLVRTQWRVDGTGCRDDITEFVADNLGLPIVGNDAEPPADLTGQDRISWVEHVRLSLLMLPFGHSYFEQVYRIDPETGLFRLRKLGPRLPRTISHIEVASDGGLMWIEQYGAGPGSNDLKLPVNRLVAYVLDREGGNWFGQSLLRSCYKNWRFKDQALRTWSTSVDRNGVGVPVGTAAEGATEEQMNDLEDIVTSMRAGENAGAALPAGAKIELVGVKGPTTDIEKYVAYHDSQIARSALGHFLNLGGQTNGQVGSYNLGSVLADTFQSSLETVNALVGATAKDHVVGDLVQINWGNGIRIPRLVPDPVGTTQSELDRVRQATGLTSDADLVRYLRSVPEQGAA